MFEKINLQELAELQGAERAFLGLYAPGNRALKLLDEREGRIRAFLSDEPDEPEHFEENVKLLRDALEENPEAQESDGLVLFACWALDRVHVNKLHRVEERTSYKSGMRRPRAAVKVAAHDRMATWQNSHRSGTR